MVRVVELVMITSVNGIQTIIKFDMVRHWRKDWVMMVLVNT